MPADPNLLDSITDVSETDQGMIVVSGSHGGYFPAALASAKGIRAAIFNDAGIGLDGAGIAGVMALSKVGMAAAASDCMTCRIGSADDMMGHGVVSAVNAPAAELGLTVGMLVAEAAELLDCSVEPPRRLAVPKEARWEQTIENAGSPVLCVDSASLVTAEDAGRVIVTGSHGGLIGGNPNRALKTVAGLAVFNDAGIGKDGIGVTRLPALDERAIPAVAVAHTSCHIGSALSTLAHGTISATNRAASDLGAKPGMMLKALIRQMD